MDTFLEKLVTKRRTFSDNLTTFGILMAGIILVLVSLSIQLLNQLGVGLLIAVGVAYLTYRFISARNIEYEYIVTNGDLDIDKIISRRKRKRIFSAS